MIHLAQDTRFIFEFSREAETAGKDFRKDSRRQNALPVSIVGVVRLTAPAQTDGGAGFAGADALTIEYGHALSPIWN